MEKARNPAKVFASVSHQTLNRVKKLTGEKTIMKGENISGSLLIRSLYKLAGINLLTSPHNTTRFRRYCDASDQRATNQWLISTEGVSGPHVSSLLRDGSELCFRERDEEDTHGAKNTKQENRKATLSSPFSPRISKNGKVICAALNISFWQFYVQKILVIRKGGSEKGLEYKFN